MSNNIIQLMTNDLMIFHRNLKNTTPNKAIIKKRLRSMLKFNKNLKKY